MFFLLLLFLLYVFLVRSFYSFYLMNYFTFFSLYFLEYTTVGLLITYKLAVKAKRNSKSTKASYLDCRLHQATVLHDYRYRYPVDLTWEVLSIGARVLA